MSSKTFKSALGTTELEVVKYSDSIGALFIRSEDGEDLAGFYFDQTSVPAQALAVLEAAGVESVYHGSFVAGSEWQLEHATDELREYVRARAVKDAEAKAQAELEAEALELFNTARATRDIEPLEWDEVADKDTWVAVARRAREIRNEKKVTTDD